MIYVYQIILSLFNCHLFLLFSLKVFRQYHKRLGDKHEKESPACVYYVMNQEDKFNLWCYVANYITTGIIQFSVRKWLKKSTPT